MSLYSNYLPKSRGAAALSDEELRRCAPSIFASQPIDTVSDRYSFLPTSSVLKGMRENGWLPVRAEQQSVRTEARRGFQKHLIRFARAEHLGSWEKNQVRPEVVLLNSHDKSSAYQLHCGLFRLVCSNGMVVSDARFTGSRSSISDSIRIRSSKPLLQSLAPYPISWIRYGSSKIGS